MKRALDELPEEAWIALLILAYFILLRIAQCAVAYG